MKKLLIIILLVCPFFFNGNILAQNKNEVKSTAEIMPAPIGGIAAIQQLVVYPKKAVKAKTQGRVFVEALVNKKGIVEETKIIRGIGNGCDEAAIKAVKQTKFTPAKDNNKPVSVKVVVPIQFKLKECEKNCGGKDGTHKKS